jgi:hypothetical protein
MYIEESGWEHICDKERKKAIYLLSFRDFKFCVCGVTRFGDTFLLW